MPDIERRTLQMRAAATAGAPDAAREYGRLLCLEPSADEGSVERWLRAALAARSDDAEAAVLLASQLLQQADVMRSPDYLTDDEDDADDDADEVRWAGIESLEDEARQLCDDVLQVSPGNGAALALRDMSAGALRADGYSYYSVEREHWGGSLGIREFLVVADADELRWACATWVAETGHLEGLALRVYTSGSCVDTVDLAAVREIDRQVTWDAVTIPPLPGEPLPAGHPVAVDGAVAHYGHSSMVIDE